MEEKSASNGKCVCKWGSYFYCFCLSTRSNHPAHPLPLPPFLERPPPTFPSLRRPPSSSSFSSPSTCFLFAAPSKSVQVSFKTGSLPPPLLPLLPSSAPPLLSQVSRPPGVRQGFSCPGFPPAVGHSVLGTASGCHFLSYRNKTSANLHQSSFFFPPLSHST